MKIFKKLAVNVAVGIVTTEILRWYREQRKIGIEQLFSPEAVAMVERRKRERMDLSKDILTELLIKITSKKLANPEVPSGWEEGS